MATRLRNTFIALVGLALAAAAFVTLGQDTSYRVDLESVREIWSDLIHDADKVGLGLTRVSTREEIEIGAAINAGMPVTLLDPRLAYVETVGRRIAGNAHRKDMPFQFHILRMAQINAFATAGGHIYVTQPMLDLMETEAELAAILGHEISHVDLRHCIERMQYEIHLRRIVGPLADVFGLAYWLFGVAYTHQQESEADRSGVLLMAQAGYDPAAAVGLDQRLKDRLTRAEAAPAKPHGPITEATNAVDKLLSDYFKTHPDWSGRILQFKTLIAQNQSAWRERTFCDGRVNFAERTPCFAKAIPGEMKTFDEVMQELNAEPAAEPPEPVPTPAPTPAATKPPVGDPSLRTAETVAQALEWGGDALRDGSKVRALAYFEQALTMAVDAIHALNAPDGSDEGMRRRADLRTALLADFDLARDLNQQIVWRIDPSLVQYQRYQVEEICRLALLPDQRAWDEREPFVPAVADAERRGLTPAACWSLKYYSR